MSDQLFEGLSKPGGFMLSPGIHVIESPLGDRIVRQFLLTGDRGTLIVDTGLHSTPVEYIGPYLERIGLPTKDVKYILISHADLDHQGGNDSARAAFPNALFLCHAADRSLIESTTELIEQRYGEFRNDHGIGDEAKTTAWIRDVCHSETPMDVVLEGEAVIRLGSAWSVRILQTPGHSRGHLSVWDERARTAIVADAALRSCLPQGNGQPAFPPTYRYLEEYRLTIASLRALGAVRLLTSHFPLLAGAEVDAFLSESLLFTEKLQRALDTELDSANGPLTTRELIEAISPHVGDWPEAAAVYLVYPLMGHLECIERMGQIQRKYDDGLVRWSRVHAS